MSFMSLKSFQFALDGGVLVFMKLGWSDEDEIDKVSSVFEVMRVLRLFELFKWCIMVL